MSTDHFEGGEAHDLKSTMSTFESNVKIRCFFSDTFRISGTSFVLNLV